jgi:transcriptional regulator with XRE-family HTH domain
MWVRRPDFVHQQMLARRGDQIRQAMVRAGLSQVELAQLLGIRQGNLHKILTGERPGTNLLPKIARACGLSAHHLSNPPSPLKGSETGTRRIATGRALASMTSTADEAYVLADIVADRVVKRLIVEAAGFKSAYRRGHHEVVVCILPRKREQ